MTIVQWLYEKINFKVEFRNILVYSLIEVQDSLCDKKCDDSSVVVGKNLSVFVNWIIKYVI